MAVIPYARKHWFNKRQVLQGTFAGKRTFHVVQWRPNKNLPVNSDMIIEKAKKFGGELGVVGFSYSNGWLEWFKKRHGILLHKVYGESNEVNLAHVEKSREELRCIISKYELSDVYNIDETGLFYRLEPDATLATGPVKGNKKIKKTNYGHTLHECNWNG